MLCYLDTLMYTGYNVSSCMQCKPSQVACEHCFVCISPLSPTLSLFQISMFSCAGMTVKMAFALLRQITQTWFAMAAHGLPTLTFPGDTSWMHPSPSMTEAPSTALTRSRATPTTHSCPRTTRSTKFALKMVNLRMAQQMCHPV